MECVVSCVRKARPLRCCTRPTPLSRDGRSGRRRSCWCPGLSFTAALCIATNFACAALALKVCACRRDHPSACDCTVIASPAARDYGPPGTAMSASGASPEPGRAEHRVHLRDTAGGVSHRHGTRCRGVCALEQSADFSHLRDRLP
jgi:hypothetical protein